MSPDLFEKWEHLVQDVEKTRIPVEFLKKIVIKLAGRRQKTINVQSLFEQGLEADELEEEISVRMAPYDPDINDDVLSVEFVLDIEGIADIVQPETDNILRGL